MFQGFCKTADVAVETFGFPMIWNHDVHGPDARHKAFRVLDQRQDFFLVRDGEVCSPPHRIGASFLEPLGQRSEEHTSELQSLMRISYAVFCLKKKKYANNNIVTTHIN